MTKVVKEYVETLSDVALDTSQLDAVYEDLETISHSSFDFIKQLKTIDSSPSLTANQREEFVERAYGEANPYVVNILKVLIDNRHISIVENVFKPLQNLYSKYYKQDFAIIESAYEPSEDEISRIVELIKKRIELSNVIVNTKINQDLTDGSRAKAGTTVMDGGVRNDLAQLQRKFERAN